MSRVVVFRNDPVKSEINRNNKIILLKAIKIGKNHHKLSIYVQSKTYYTSNNQRLGSAFDDLNPRLSPL